MKGRLNMLWVWLCRMGCSRGFGIQSPTDYAFVRYVINEHWPYYAYDELDNLANNATERKLGRLYLRLANWRQPSVMLRDEYEAWWHAGCRKMRLTDYPQEAMGSRGTFQLARITIEDDADLLLRHADEESVLVVEGIHRNTERWRHIKECEQVTITYDLYYCGIVLFDSHRYKHHYRVNF